MKKTTFSWEELEAISGNSAPRPRPPNAFTAEEYAERYAVTVRTAIERLKKLVDAGKLDRLRYINEQSKLTFCYLFKRGRVSKK